MKYRARCDCTDFSGRFFERGSIVDFDAGEKISRHFILIDEEPTPTPVSKVEVEVEDRRLNDLEDMTKAQLLHYAAVHGLEVSPRKKIDEVRELIINALFKD